MAVSASRNDDCFSRSSGTDCRLRFGDPAIASQMKTCTISQARTLILTSLAVHNVVQNRFLGEQGYVAGNLVVTAGVLGVARSCGLSARDLGLTGADRRATWLVGASTLVAGVGFLALSALLPALASRLDDGRIPDVALGNAVRRALIRFPLGTALFEEVVFRGVLPPLLAPGFEQSGDRRAALAFGLWHLIPTHHVFSVNELATGRARRFVGTLVGSAAAGVAGYFLARLRRRTGSILAPWSVHAVVNAASYIGVVLARRYRARA